MPRKRKSGKRDENRLLDAIEKTRLVDEYLPAVQEFLAKGGTIEGFLRKSAPVAYARLSEQMFDENPAVAQKAIIEILNRAEGKPVERKQVLYQDVGEMSEKQLNAEILKSLKQDPELSGLLPELAEKPAKQPAKRKPSIIDLDEE